MKTNIKFILSGIFATSLVCASCSKDMLKENLYSQVGATNVSGPQGAALLTNGIYPYIQFLSYNGGNNWLLTTEANTDEFFCNWGGTPETGWAGAQNFLNLDASHSMVGLIWDSLYKIVTQSNAVVTQYGSFTDAPTIQNVAQARFWRAYAYQKLYSVYGPVPLVKGGEDLSKGIAKATKADMETFIEAEMKAIEAVLPATYSSSDYGRPSKWAVKAFLARFYLNQKNWQKASDYAKDVITNSGAGLQTDYASVFSKDGNSEILLAVNEIAQAGKGNKYVALSMESNVRDALGITGVSASNGYGMSTPFFRTFASGDLRAAPFDAATKTGIMVSGVLRKADGSPVFGTAANPVTVEQQLSRVLSFKFPVQANIPNGEDADADVPLLRLGETYLSYAEAQNELGNTPEALNYVNPLRRRAHVVELSGLSQAAARTAILNERGWETYHEGYRREDLVRAGLLLSKVAEKYQFYMGKPMSWANNSDRLLLPIPTTALQLNSLLKQNTGY
ncbi:RagB/SusD family nutrient uptake outer membrane protein [Pedobacter sp. HMWF019]|uniref:RagB/SusD family nutrient uptake outer membrane protein n=1 Tax=Pedobacter sp. HMWF019 TaxID=2056856 RepID=UPI000D3D0EBE|nr:RagB/SusD family nutrient uptake outer membrane protein [Pedobacter sp. HMWF019]PTT01069.1 RagB/SusD family nutrient uptake outer membrane protein [Pedobacter sp. HMWF019]